jgi:hypothetical protein
MKILDRLPFSERRSEVWTPDRLATVKPYQIIVTVSLAVRELMKPDLGWPRFPAILDTGNNHNFAISEQHLRSWAGITPAESRHHIRVQGRQVPLINAGLWLFPNEPGDLAPSGRPPTRLALPEGIAVYPENLPNPARLPILGLRALVNNDLKLIINGKRCVVTLKTPGWFWVRERLSST